MTWRHFLASSTENWTTIASFDNFIFFFFFSLLLLISVVLFFLRSVETGAGYEGTRSTVRRPLSFSIRSSPTGRGRRDLGEMMEVEVLFRGRKLAGSGSCGVIFGLVSISWSRFLLRTIAGAN